MIFITVIGPEYVPSLSSPPFPLPSFLPSLLPSFSPSILFNFTQILNYVRRNHGSHFEKHKPAFDRGAAGDDAVLEDVGEGEGEGSFDEKRGSGASGGVGGVVGGSGSGGMGEKARMEEKGENLGMDRGGEKGVARGDENFMEKEKEKNLKDVETV